MFDSLKKLEEEIKGLGNPDWHEINTEVCEGRIIQTHRLSGLNQYIQHVMDTREAATKEALIKLGWTPPEETPPERAHANDKPKEEKAKKKLKRAKEALLKRRDGLHEQIRVIDGAYYKTNSVFWSGAIDRRESKIRLIEGLYRQAFGEPCPPAENI